MRTLLLFLLCASQWSWVQGNYFCNFKCGSKHTVCRRKYCRISLACGPRGKMLLLNDEDRQHILDLHNDYRNKLAQGKDTTGGNGEASNMRALSYDKELEFVAQCWANGCRETGKTHDVCRTTKKFYFAGQNMMGGKYSKGTDLLNREYLTTAVKMWYGEIKMTNAEMIDKYNGDLSVGHFTQVVWAKTTHIGCGRSSSESGDYTSLLLYCNYGIGGNMVGAPVYLRGKPCSDCQKERCNSRYSGLCGQIRRMSDDKWEPPFVMGASTIKGTRSIVLVIVSILIK